MSAHTCRSDCGITIIHDSLILCLDFVHWLQSLPQCFITDQAAFPCTYIHLSGSSDSYHMPYVIILSACIIIIVRYRVQGIYVI